MGDPAVKADRLLSDEDIAREWNAIPAGFSWPQRFAARIEALVRKRLAERLRAGPVTEWDTVEWAARIVEADDER